MLLQSAISYDPENRLQLRVIGSGLCQDLEREIVRIESGQVEFDELEQLYDSIYQPKALALVTALLNYVPDTDPRIMMISRFGDQRTLKSNDLTMAAQALHRDLEAAQLDTLVSCLRALLQYLPEN